MASDLHDLQKRIESYTDDDLKRIACEEADDYIPEVLALVNVELARRNIILETAREKNDSIETSSLLVVAVRRVRLTDRFWARAIDFIAILIVSFVFALAAYLAFSELRGTETEGNIFEQSTVITSWSVLYLLFWTLRDGYRDGTGLGKNANKLIVLNLMDLTPCGYAQSMLRNIISEAATISLATAFHQLIIGRVAGIVVVGIDIWRILETYGGRRLGDLVARTQILYQSDYERIKAVIGAQRARSLLEEELTSLQTRNIECPECGSSLELNKIERTTMNCVCSECSQTMDILAIELDSNESRHEEVAA